jgi:hypothetical protein
MRDVDPPNPQRVSAWVALSELFLDLELDERDIESIAERLRRTNIGFIELQHIYENEVAPACWRNLTAIPGGVWSGFEREWLIETITHQLSSRRPVQTFINRLQIRKWTALTRNDWERVRAYLVP